MIKGNPMKYKRLARSKRGLGKWHTLWLGDDHLLTVESTGYSEEYTRYHLKDIQAVITRRTAWGTVWNLIFGLVAAISLFAGLADFSANHGEPTGTFIMACIFGAISLPFLLWNLFRGPTCRCHIRSSVGIGELPALDRVRSAKKVLTRLRPLISQRQGNISREEIASLTRAAMEAPPIIPPVARNAQPFPSLTQQVPGTISSYRGGVHRGAFLLLVVDGGLSALQMLQNSKAMVGLTFLAALLFLLLAVAALIKQKEHKVPPLAMKMTWGSVITMLAGSIIGYFFMIFLSFEKFTHGISTQSQILDLYAAIDPAAHPSYVVFLLSYAVIAAGIGITGLFAMERDRIITGKIRL
jgi:uncharacterized integral membrane protein